MRRASALSAVGFLALTVYAGACSPSSSSGGSFVGGRGSGAGGGRAGTSGIDSSATGSIGGCDANGWTEGTTGGSAGATGAPVIPLSCSTNGEICALTDGGAGDGGLCSDQRCVCRVGIMPHSPTSWCVQVTLVQNGEKASPTACASVAGDGTPGEAGLYDQQVQGTGLQPGFQTTPTSDGGPILSDEVTGLRWQAIAVGGVGQAEAAAYCQGLSLSETWRLPTPAEAIGILDYGSPGLVSGGFSAAGDVWTNAALVGTEQAVGWAVSEQTGQTRTLPAETPLAVRCVSDADAQCTQPLQRFVSLDAYRTLDAQTGLTWQKAPLAGSQDWQDALGCVSLAPDGPDPWHLPSVKELETLVDYAHRDPAIDPDAFELPNPCSGGALYWTSTADIADPDLQSVFAVDFTYGAVTTALFTDFAEALCVH